MWGSTVFPRSRWSHYPQNLAVKQRKTTTSRKTARCIRWWRNYESSGHAQEYGSGSHVVSTARDTGHTVTKRRTEIVIAHLWSAWLSKPRVSTRKKLMLQEICQQRFDWDIPLQGDIIQRWNSLAGDLIEVTFAMQCLQHDAQSDEKQFHVFVDANITSYRPSAYISSCRNSRLEMAKNRVAPLRALTLPHLKLLATVTGEDLQNIYRCRWNQLLHFMLHWLSTTKRYPVAHRTNMDHWKSKMACFFLESTIYFTPHSPRKTHLNIRRHFNTL